MSDQCERINFKVMQSHKVALRKLSRIQGEPMSVVIRQLIREAAMAQGVWQDGFTTKSTPFDDSLGRKENTG